MECIRSLVNVWLTFLLGLNCLWINVRENTEEVIKKGQSRETGNIGYTRRRQTKQKQFRETGNIGYTRRRKTKQKHNTIYIGHHNTQTNTNNGIKTWALLQTTGGIDNRTSFLCGNLNGHRNTELTNRRIVVISGN